MSEFNQKTVQDLYNKFMKRNKVARESFAKKNGYETGAEFLAYLKGALLAFKNKTTVKKTSKKKQTKLKDIVIHNVHILDASGSMSGAKMRSALEGINTEVSELKQDTSTEYIHSLVSFGSYNDIISHEDRTPIKLVPRIGMTTRGMTALYQAICVTLSKLTDNVKDNEKTIVKIFTDGGENQSRGYDAQMVDDAIKRAEKVGITVTFVGTRTDVKNILHRISSLRANNTLVHDNTSAGIKMSFKTSNMATKTYVKKAKRGEAVLDGFYKQEGTL